VVQEHGDELALLETLDNGKTFTQAGLGQGWGRAGAGAGLLQAASGL